MSQCCLSRSSPIQLVGYDLRGDSVTYIFSGNRPGITMSSDDSQLPPPNGDTERVDFHHPFTPYDVQIHFMRAVYDVLQRGQGQIGILESPTGTVCCVVSSYACSTTTTPFLLCQRRVSCVLAEQRSKYNYSSAPTSG